MKELIKAFDNIINKLESDNSELYAFAIAEIKKLRRECLKSMVFDADARRAFAQCNAEVVEEMEQIAAETFEQDCIDEISRSLRSETIRN